MKSWLESLTEDLLKSSTDTKKRLVSGVVLLCCFHRMSNYIQSPSEETSLSLLQLLVLSPPSVDEELSYLNSLIKSKDTK